jgi:hypothetical protein
MGTDVALALFGEVSIVGNSNIHAEQKISFMNEMKQYEICPRPKG